MFSDTTTAPHRMLQGFKYRQPSSFYVVDSAAPKGYERTITETNEEWSGLTFAAADSIAATKRALTTGDSNVYDAYWSLQNDAGMYRIHVTHKQRTAWSAIP